jgi:serine-type D-Ala-D-Ala carboxypeptidase
MPSRDEGRKVDAILHESAIRMIPPSIDVRATQLGFPLYSAHAGHHYKYFDVASLTKVLVTVPLTMILFERGLLKLTDEVSEHLPYLEGTAPGRVHIRDLLRHLSGLTWWKPFYKEFLKVAPVERVQLLKHKFRFEKVAPQKLSGLLRCVYSDLDFILLGWIIEEKLAMGLDEAAALFLFKPLGLKNSFFIRSEKTPFPRSQFAPTSKDRRRGLVQGSVFDDNAWSLGGVSGHAGLFSTIEDVHKLGEIFLNSCLLKRMADVPWKSSTMKLFASRAVKAGQGDWALGFAMPTLPNTNAGGLISKSAFGHWAFTGPSLWIDPVRRTVVTILANRTFPKVSDEAKYKQFQQLRRAVHDGIWEMADAR